MYFTLKIIHENSNQKDFSTNKTELKDQNRTFSDKLWNSAALLLFDEERGSEAGFDGNSEASPFFNQKKEEKKNHPSKKLNLYSINRG